MLDAVPSRRRVSGHRHRGVDWLLAIALVAATLWYAVRWLDVATFPVAVAQSLVPVVGIGLVLITTLAAGLRRRRIALAGVAASLVVLVGALPFVVPSGREAPGPGDLVVMASNLEFGGADVSALLEQVRGRRVDVLVLLEITPDAVQRLAAAGLDDLLPYAAGHPRAGADGTMIRSRYPLTELPTPTFPGEVNLSQPVALVTLPGSVTVGGAQQVLVRAVHPMPPTGSNLGFWRASLDGLATWVHSQPDGIPLVLAGDFNASADHPGYRQVADGLVDAHRAVGAGWVRTWPLGRLWLPPFVQIDHVLARGLTVTGAGSEVIAGTDHALVWASWR